MTRLKDIWIWLTYPIFMLYKDIAVAISVFLEVRKLQRFSLFILDLKPRRYRVDRASAILHMYAITRGVKRQFTRNLSRCIFQHLEKEIEKENKEIEEVDEKKETKKDEDETDAPSRCMMS